MIMTLGMLDGRRVCEGLGWYDQGTIYCVLADGAISANGHRLAGVPAGTVPSGSTAVIRHGLAAAVHASEETLSFTRLPGGQTTVVEVEHPRPAVGRGCVAWLQPLAAGGQALRVAGREGKVVDWGPVPWGSIEDVADCDKLVIGRDGEGLYRTAPGTTASLSSIGGVPIDDPRRWRLEGHCTAHLAIEAHIVDLGCGKRRTRIELPDSWDDEGYIALDRSDSTRTGFGLLVHGAPGRMLATFWGGSAEPAVSSEVHFAPGRIVPTQVVVVDHQLCVVWHANDGPTSEGTWMSCR